MDHSANPVVEHEGENGTGVCKATLYVVATPIGNLSDITLRALEILRAVDVIAAEDTRVTVKLLNRHGISARLLAVHEHNERRASERLVGLLAEGKSVALVSDAGTPGIADPGALAAAEVRGAGYAVIPVPGPNAAVTALSVSGFDASRYLFCGFLPPRSSERRRMLAKLAGQTATLVFYEAPHRVVASVADICAAFGGERDIVMARELTKIHESVHRCRLEDAAGWLQGDEMRSRGEFVLVVQGASEAPEAEGFDAETVLRILLEELPLKQAVALAVKLTGGHRNTLYRMALELKNNA